MTARPVPRAQLPAGVACVLTANGSPPDATELAQIEQFKTFLRRAKEVGEGPACAEVYGDECQEHGGCRYCRATPTTTTGA